MTVERPPPANAGVSARMRRQRTSDTQVELAVRKALFSSGVRYRKHYPVPGRPRRSIDIAFPGKRIAVFVDGCFWHGCALHKTIPRSNDGWWAAKLEQNKQRDAETTDLLTEQGWRVLRFWEHDPVEEVVRAVRNALAQ